MLKLFAALAVLSLAIGFTPAVANCGPAHPCQGALCE